MLPTIKTLAIEIENSWARFGYAENVFCEIAAIHLAQPLDLNFTTLAHHICEGLVLPEQRRRDQGFGQPSLTLYHGERFLIEALCWHSGTPAIHQHSFSGAFRMMTGQSVHSCYSFTESEHLDQITLGELRLENVEILNEHSTVKIPRGRGLIHSAFHLDSPSMTIVVRTYQTNEPELTYLPPGVAYDPSLRSPSLHKRLQLLDTLNLTGHDSYCDCVRAAIGSTNLYDGMEILMRVGYHCVDELMFCEFTRRLSDLHGTKIRQVITALIEERRRNSIIRLRAGVTDPDTRFFIASLINFSCRADLLSAMELRYGNRVTARDHIVKGVSNLIGGDRDRQTIVMSVASAMLDNLPAKSFPELAARLWNRPITTQEGADLERFYEQIMEHPLLTPLQNG